MNPEFRSIDLETLDIPATDGVRMVRADLPFNTSIPFAIVHYEADESARKLPPTLRLDLGKRVFLDNVLDPQMRRAASRLSEYLGAIRLVPEPALAAVH